MKTLMAQRRQMYDVFSEYHWDTMQDDVRHNPLDCPQVVMSSPANLIRAFKDGFTMCLVPHLMDELEALHTSKENFILVVEDAGKIWCVVNGEDLVW